MRIHSDILTYQDIWAATSKAGPMVGVEATKHGSRKRAHAFNVTLTGTSTRRPNNRGAWEEMDDYAATWDEWGIFLQHLFSVDYRATIPGVYEGRDDFEYKTDWRFWDLTPEQQHGGAGHRWEYSVMLARFECKTEGCLAVKRH